MRFPPPTPPLSREEGTGPNSASSQKLPLYREITEGSHTIPSSYPKHNKLQFSQKTFKRSLMNPTLRKFTDIPSKVEQYTQQYIVYLHISEYILKCLQFITQHSMAVHSVPAYRAVNT